MTDVLLYIDGAWREGARSEPYINPANEEVIGRVHHASKTDLEQALAAAEKGFAAWRKVSAFERCKIMRKAADIVRSRIDEIARTLTLEQGKPLAEAKGEPSNGADLIDWFAEEGRRTYGHIIPSRAANITQTVTKEPVGVVAAFTPWNFPINQAVRKISAALAAGCAIVLKGPENTPASVAALVRAFADAGVPPGVINLVFGVPAEISEYLIPHPIVRKVSFTGSTAVGKHLASLAGAHMKPVTMELGGHAPVIVCPDANVDLAVKLLAGAKFRNAGQICTSPTRFMIQEQLFDDFVEKFVARAAALKIGDGLQPDTGMGPLAHARRIEAMEAIIADALDKGAKIRTGGKRIGNRGFFFEPTVLTDVDLSMRIMNEEPFGPVVPVTPYAELDTALTEANRLPYGLAAYAYTGSGDTAATIAASIQSGMVAINHHGLGAPETPFGGVRDSGFGTEGGSEAVGEYMITKFVTYASTH
jgi:succinate-semialdehyde dehydrogenase/glutarate-semialdehyde dehydrogenase